MKTRTRKPFTQIARPSDRVGDIALIGCYGGAIVSHYQIAAIENGDSHYVPVEMRSVRNSGGTFSTKVVRV